VDTYEAVTPDELGESTRKFIAQTMEEQLKAGLAPISAQLKGVEASLGRIEGGIERLGAHLDAWGDKLLQGQGELRAQIERVLEESKAGHALTQQMLGNMMKAELRAGLRSLSDGLALLQKDPQDGMARGQLIEAKSSLVKHLEFLREEEAAGRATAVEHWAVVRLALASSYLGIGLERQAVAELEELMALPVQGEGLARLRERLPAELQTAKVRYFDERTPALDVRAQGLQFTEQRLGEWLEALKGERGRLGELKRRAGELVAGSEVLREAWAERAGRAGARARGGGGGGGGAGAGGGGRAGAAGADGAGGGVLEEAD